ncbi:WXG100 family type VII secretion target [Kitasatospora sp. NPDC057965]|uniref:WXG100 family type VII secretion target n=1 Tax=Kitasatospora sp. NPDC057965 TaxID=3346291 RepID=UPI0036DF2DE6
MAGGTNFEGIHHAGLKNMVKGSDPTKVLSRGTQLQAAGRVLKDLGAALKAHASQIAWEGPAAESFKAWVGNLQQSAALLGDYSKSAGDAMHQAGEALSTAKAAVPEVPEQDIKTVNGRQTQGSPNPMALTKANLTIDGGTTANIDSIMKRSYNSNWVSEADAQAAAHRVYLAHQEAIHQMEKLGQAYDAATTKLNSLGDVTLPGTPESGSRDSSSDYSKGGGGGGVGGGGGGAVRSLAPSVGGGNGPVGGGYVSSGGSVTPRPPASVPDGPRTPGHSTPIPPSHGGSVPLPGDPGTPGTVTPPTTFPGDRPGTGLDSLPTVPTLPGHTGPVGPAGGGPVPSYPQGGGPGQPGIPGGGPGPFPGGGPIPLGGTGPFTGGTVPLKGGGGGSVPPNRTSTFGGGNPSAKGGAPVPTNGGAVFGAREAAQGRAGGPAGGGGFGGPGGAMHPGGGGHGGGAVGGSRGRGYSSTVGGVVGGAKGPVAGGEFTPGGSGLRNRAAAAGAAAAEGAARPGQNGMMGPSMTGGAGERRERERRRRADYLHEDEETWTSGTSKSNPGVIE